MATTPPHQGSFLSSGSSYNHNIKANNSTTMGPRSKCDQVVFEAMCKACEVIVGSRTTLVGNGSSRFNLQVPEVATVRSILTQYYRQQQLYIPVRLDVFYQTTVTTNPADPTNGSNGQQGGGVKRDLLERWALQYIPVSSERFLQEENLLTNDPMIQLTHVCRRIVLWLRTLYCAARLLPAGTIGSQLGDPKKIGFSVYIHHDDGQNSNAVDDLRLPGFIIQDFAKPVTTPYGALSWKVAYCTNIERWIPKRRSVRIVQTPSQPIPMSTMKQKQQHPESQQHTAAASAPARQLSYTERSQQRHRLQTGKSFDPSTNHLHHRPSPTTHQPSSNSAIVMNPIKTGKSTNRQQPPIPENGEPPERVMSGLSLAMMTAADDRSTWSSNSDHDGVMVPEQDDETTLQEKARRAALHEAPPHMREQDYGYAYNNHINWQKLQQQRAASPLLHPMVGTPPGTALFAATGAAAAAAATPSIGMRSRSRSDSGGSNSTATPITPPFPPRPSGFVTDRAPLRPFCDPPVNNHNSSNHQHHSMMTMMMTTMEQQHPWMSMASTTADLANTVLPSSLLLEPSSSTAVMDLMEDMPFAITSVFDTNASTNNSAVGGGGGSGSTSLVQLAQKCTTTRLKLFDPQDEASTSFMMNTTTIEDLASQLDSMRAFGESLMIHDDGDSNMANLGSGSRASVSSGL